MSEDKAYLFEAYLRILAPDAPEPVKEYQFAMAQMKRKWKADYAWPEHKVIVEIDGGQYAFRGGRHATDTDREKLNAAALLGWRVFRFSPDMLKHAPDKCINQIVESLKGSDK